MKIRTSIYLDGGLLHKLKREALRQQRSVSQLIDIVVQHHFLRVEAGSQPANRKPATATTPALTPSL